MEDDELSPRSDFEKLMSALTSDLSNARQAWEMYDIGAYELTPEEDAKANKVMMDIEAREIVRDSLKGGKDLKALGYDFHQVFMDAYGFTPPKSKEFELWGGKTKDEELSLKATVGGKKLEFEFWYDQQFSNYIIEPWFRFDTMHDTDGDVSLLSDHIIIREGDVERKVSKEELPSALRSAMGIPWDANLPEWPELPKGQPPVDGPEGTDEPVYEGKQKLNKSYLMETIAEVMSEIGENFGETPSGGLLHEAWDSQWPSHFSELKTVIQDLTHKQQKTPKEILAKYALEAMSFKFLKPVAAEFNDDNWGIWGAYEHVLGEEIKMYVRDEGDIEKIEEFVSRVFNKQTKIDWTQKFFDVRRDKGNEAALRVLNKMISSLDKQIFGKPKEEGELAGIFGALEDKGVDWKSVSEQFAKEITGVLQGMQFKEGSLAQSRIHKIIKFVNLDKSDDNAKKLEAYYDNIKAAANSDEIDVMAIANNLQIIQITNSWVEEQLHTIDMVSCSDALIGEPCVMHKFDDGFFWYDISSDTCEITAQKMNSCGDASMSGSELFNLMSHSETGKPRWHVTVEWNEEEKAFIQVLGNANTVPKKEYWPHIKWLYENYGKPEISGYAWEHVQGNNVKQNVYAFLKYLGLKSSEPLTDGWVQMKQQINDGFYNVYSFEGDRAPEGDFSRLRFFEQAERVDMSIRIRRKLLKVGSQKGAAEWDDIRDYKNAARGLQRKEVLADDYILDMIPHEWREFFKEKGWTQRARFSHGGNMMLYFNWTSIPLQEMDGGRNDDPAYRNQLQREGLAFFLKEMGENFSVERMTKLGKDFGDQLAHAADEIAMSRPMRDLDEESQNILSELLQLSVLDESQYYYDAQDLDTDQAEQAIDLGQSLGGEDDRDRSDQVDKYVSLKVKKVLKDAIKTETMNAISMLVAEAADHIGLWSDSDDNAEHVSRTVNELSSLYERALLKPLGAVEEFDGSQESLDKWIDAMESVEQSLMKARDPAFHYLGKISPDYFLISDYYVTGEDDDWGERTDRKDVKPRTAVKEAEEFFRPAIMKTIMGIQGRESGVDVGEMFGLNESLSGMFSSVENANQALELMITMGQIPEPIKLEVNEQWGSIYIKFNSNEELQQLINLLDKYGLTRQEGGTPQIPAYFVNKVLMSKRKQFYRSDEEPPKPPPPTSLTLKF